MKIFYSLLFTLIFISSFQAYAQCTMPHGQPDAEMGVIVFNKDHKVMQYCNGDEWIGIWGGGGGGSGSSHWMKNGSALYYNGNVGIGTSNPAFATGGASGLHISDATSPAIRLEEAGAHNFYIGVDGGQIYIRPNNLGTMDAVTILSGGNVGIGGITNPLTQLHVANHILAEGSTYPALYIINTSKANGVYGRTWGWMNYGGGLALNAYASSAGGLAPGAPVNAMFVADGTGYVGVKTIDATHALTVGGIARATQATFATSSDARVKENIEPIDDGLSTILRLRPVTYEYTAVYQDGNADMAGLRRGFIAQEVEKILPQSVSRANERVGDKTIDDFRILSNDDFAPLLVRAVQQLEARIEVLEQGE